MDAEALTFPAQVVKVQTLTDSGLRLTLDMPESEIVAFAWLAQCKRAGVVLEITCKPDKEVLTGVKTGYMATGAIGESQGQTQDQGTVGTSAGSGQQDYRSRRQAHRG